MTAFISLICAELFTVSYKQGRVFGYIVYTEQRKNHGTTILHRVSYSAYTLR